MNTKTKTPRVIIALPALALVVLSLALSGCRQSPDGGDDQGHSHDDSSHTHGPSGHTHADGTTHTEDDHAADEEAAADHAAESGHVHADGTTHDADDHDHEHSADEGAVIIDIPPAVRSNLGISFVEVEMRAIERTLRVPGRFEYQPTARREYHTMLAGRVEPMVDQFDQIAPGDVLYRVQSPDWRGLQQELNDTLLRIEQLTSRLESFGPLTQAHEEHERILEESVDVWRERVEQLDALSASAGGRANELAAARGSLAVARAELSEVQERDAELRAARAETTADLASARSTYTFLLESSALLVGLEPEELSEPVETEHGELPRWRTIKTVAVTAETEGVVEAINLTPGAWVDEGTLVLSVVQPRRLRFHASGLQSDLALLRDGLPARIVPPAPSTEQRAIHLQDTMTGSLALGLTGNPDQRTVDLYVTPEELTAWARPGVAAQMEIVTEGTTALQPSIPLAAVQWDGLVPVIFVRDHDHSDEAIRIRATLGLDDGRWVALADDALHAGDEVVLNGAFQLMIATSTDGEQNQGGHFHADGTFHEGDD